MFMCSRHDARDVVRKQFSRAINVFITFRIFIAIYTWAVDRYTVKTCWKPLVSFCHNAAACCTAVLKSASYAHYYRTMGQGHICCCHKYFLRTQPYFWLALLDSSHVADRTNERIYARVHHLKNLPSFDKPWIRNWIICCKRTLGQNCQCNADL
jgi:hypothetical protein